jgi:hypothetical protein
MRSFVGSVVGTAVAVVVQGIAWAGGPPELDVRLSCRAADRVSVSVAGAGKALSDMQSCLDDERTAREALFRNWASFSPVDRTLCTGMNRTGGPPSYVELLTCLEVLHDARAGGTPERAAAP